jgi:hypothetical protein
VTTSGLNFFDPLRLANTFGTRGVSSSTTKAGACYLVPKDGNLRFIGFDCTAVSGSPALDVRAETVSAELPSGSLWATNTNAAYSPTLTSSFVWIQLTADAVVTAGQQIAAVVGYTSGTSATIALRAIGIYDNVQTILSRPVAMSAGAWAVTQGIPGICFKYDDGTILRGGYPVSSFASSSYNSGSSPNERATRFTAPAAVTLVGARLLLQISNTTATFSVNVYSGTSTSPIAGGTVTVAAAQYVDSQIGLADVSFMPPITLTLGQQYALSVKATNGSNITSYRALFPSTAERDVCLGEATSDTRAGSSWLGETTTTSEMIIPVFGSVTAGGGSRGILTGGRL